MAGRKVFTSEVLTSADVNGYLMEQTVMRFPSSSVRGVELPAPTEGMLSYLEDVNRYEKHDGAGWKPLIGDRTIVDAAHMLAGSLVLTGTPGWTDIASGTGTSTGLPCVVRWTGSASNGNSGTDRTMSWRVVIDGVTELGTIAGVSMPLANLPRISKGGAYRSTPAAGSHTWKLQANGSAASSVIVDHGQLHVVEVAA